MRDEFIMKENKISVRLSESENKKLEADAAAAKMKTSEYVRNLIAGVTPTADNGRQELAKQFCHLYVVISNESLDNNEALMEEVDRLCRILY